jgi:hypothetical protein
MLPKRGSTRAPGLPRAVDVARARTRLLVRGRAGNLAGHWIPRADGRISTTDTFRHYASRPGRSRPKKRSKGKHKDFSIHSAGRVWDPAGVLPQRGQVVERPRLAPRRLQGCRRRRLVGAEPDRDARQTYGGQQLELDQ